MNKKWTVLNSINEEINLEKAQLDAINGVITHKYFY